MTTLKPCPFCGGKARWRYRKPIGWVMCKKCGASSAALSDNYEEADCQQEAIAAWNSRTGKDIKVDTNADRIRSMTDEELAEYIFDLGNGSEYCYGQCAYQDDCVTKGLDHDTCIKGVTTWLRQPVKEE